MARIRLFIEDPVHYQALTTMLESAGHTITDTDPDLAFCDRADAAIRLAPTMPVLLLATITQLHEAVAAMVQGVFGYIMAPLIPGEAAIAVQRVLESAATRARAPAVTLEEVELNHILLVLDQCGGNQAEAARRLGIGRNTLWRKLKKRT